MVQSPAVRYHIDAHDRLDAVGGGWAAFAESNDGSALSESKILGRVIWEFVSDPTTVVLYTAMLKRARLGGPPIRFRFRCDSPGRRRLLSMELAAEPGGGVMFVVTPVQEELRAPEPLLDAAREASAEILTMCAWCQRVRVTAGMAGSWVEVEEAVAGLVTFTRDPLPRLSHGICPPCAETMSRMIDDVTGADAVPATVGAFTLR